MRKTLAALALALLAALPSHALNRSCHGDSLRWAGDKRAHLEYSVAIGAASRAVISDPWAAFGVSLLPGLYREAYRGECFSWQDMAYNALGSAVGVATEHWIIGPDRVVFHVEF